MTPYFNSHPMGLEQFVSQAAMAATAQRMFADGADEVRVRKVRGDRNPTRARSAQEPKAVKRGKRKAQKKARRAQRR